MSEIDRGTYESLAAVTPLPGYPQPRLRIEVEYRPSTADRPAEPRRIDVEVNHESVDYQMVAGVLDLLRVTAARTEQPASYDSDQPVSYDRGGNFPTPTTYGGDSTATTVFPAMNDRYLGEARR